ncbi:TPA: gamma-glutamylcyclotransferase [Klebsiella pneumoniae]|uniref:gamma-glutamylcyclotransferase family protein n=1 Tax=Klebsiella pneumoniae complex TaxID=3390273 RepID=UPI002380B8EA|nr:MULTISPECIES: gamma-glutamylcyclotransferase family protein [Klebsiella]MDE4782003.1 gamma-glutamylcyclotransferase [Klebsiella quasipneumoniae subsp. similipneumoniae]MDW7408228.1 gamma-glutamylcyclotransferase family protein [Klebsiella pneumoniae]HBR2735988.1 gamma-glutamylcyclotransferase [Klebsiella pneumoniae]HBR4418544.1 gamma-glutamylcyclotransferase [Klebsiella pneumoniae]HBZ1415509.1 gamma-glutamylcyclotransferase [Klebsiella pneumoniae]
MESLFVYGTLGPGRPNSHILENIGGTWCEGHVRGHLHEKGWGAGMGYPGIVLDDNGSPVNGFLFTSANLVAYWQTLDKFEGEEYERVPVNVTTIHGEVVPSCIYMLKK